MLYSVFFRFDQLIRYEIIYWNAKKKVLAIVKSPPSPSVVSEVEVLKGYFSPHSSKKKKTAVKEFFLIIHRQNSPRKIYRSYTKNTCNLLVKEHESKSFV